MRPTGARSSVAEAGAAAPVRLAVVGASPAPVCGVRDHAAILSTALAQQGFDCSTHWLVRDGAGLGGTRAQMAAWTERLRTELRAGRPDAVLLHYSVFSYSYRGFPLFVHPLLVALRTSEAPIVSVLHEYAYPWGRDGAVGRHGRSRNARRCST